MLKRMSSSSLARLVCLPLALNLASQAISSQVIRYEYDALGRLVKVERQKAGGNVEEASYEYDDAGNRLEVEATESEGQTGDPSPGQETGLQIVFNGIFFVRASGS